MQGPRFSSHSNSEGVELPALVPPKAAAYDAPPFAEQEGAGEDKEEDKKKDKEGGGGKRTRREKMEHVLMIVKRHGQFVGPGLVASVAFIDPGNWSTDLRAGSQFGYAHLFIILLSGLIALLFQVLSTRLGTVTGLDLSQHCRLALHDRPRHKMFYRWGMLYPLYVITEGAIICTDLAELLGSAIAINLLFPIIPMYAAVLLTSTDVFLILLLFNKYPTTVVTRSMRVFEFAIGLLVIAVLGSFVAILVKVSPVWVDVFTGYLPSNGIIDNGALFISVGILGATAMPHAFFIGSKMATMRRLHPHQYGEIDETYDLNSEDPVAERGPMLHLPQPVYAGSLISRFRRHTTPGEKKAYVAPPPEPRPTLARVRAHINHATVDIIGSLLGFAVLINSAILITAASVFYYGNGRGTVPEGVSDLFDAYDLIKEYIGPVFATLFAVSLLLAGQSASLTVTLTGQIISEGFIEWRTTPWKRRLITRSIGIVPSLAVSVAVGRQGIDTLLIASQVALSIVLPFVIAPLVIFTSSQSIMCVPKNPIPVLDKNLKLSPTPSEDLESSAPITKDAPQFWPKSWSEFRGALMPFRRRLGVNPDEFVSFANGMLVIYLASAIWLIVTMANFFAILQLGLVGI